MRTWPKDKVALGLVVTAVLLELVFGLTGLTWGLPNESRFVIFPPAMLSDSKMPENLEVSWKKIYQGVKQSRREDSDELMPSIKGLAEFKPFSLGPFAMDPHYYINTAMRIFKLKAQKS